VKIISIFLIILLSAATTHAECPVKHGGTVDRETYPKAGLEAKHSLLNDRDIAEFTSGLAK
jgi:hypothetical protein